MGFSLSETEGLSYFRTILTSSMKTTYREPTKTQLSYVYINRRSLSLDPLVYRSGIHSPGMVQVITCNTEPLQHGCDSSASTDFELRAGVACLSSSLSRKSETSIQVVKEQRERHRSSACSDDGRVLKKTRRKAKDEMGRRRKISEANKGHVPWNKGKTHDAETRKLISRRTIEAMSNPQVRKKMRECPRALTEELKAQVSLALRRSWRKRLRWKISAEKCYQEWGENIAAAAKAGGNDQQELDWDTYENIIAKGVEDDLQKKEEKKRVKENKERMKAVAKEEKKKEEENKKRMKARVKARLVAARAKERRIKKEQNKKARTEMNSDLNRLPRSTKDDQSTPSRKIILAKLTKIKHPLNSTMEFQDAKDDEETTSEKWDLEIAKRENIRQSVSLADQIKAARDQKARNAGTVPKD